MLNLIWNKEEDVLAERQGLEVWGYRMCMKDRMRRFLVDVLDIHNKDVIEKVIGISSIRHHPKGWALYNQGEPVDTCCFLMEGVTGAFLYTTGGKQISDDFSNVDVFVIANMDVITLFRTYPEFQTILFEWLMQAYHKQWALKSARYQMAAKERYLFFLKEYAGLEDVVSDRFLASFLDMSPETLSRQKRCLREEKPD